MPDENIIEWVREKYLAVVSDLGERGRRRWAAAEAGSLGWGGVSAVALATGMSDRTIRTGIHELDSSSLPPSTRQRRAGAGRQRREDEQPGLVPALETLVESTTRGDPMSPLRWICKSTRTLAKDLGRQGFEISRTKVSELLQSQGYSLQANRKTVEGKQHPDRGAQFQHINQRARAYQRAGQPRLSVDTKKKQTLENKKNPEKTYRRKGDPRKVKTHDFADKDLGKAVP